MDDELERGVREKERYPSRRVTMIGFPEFYFYQKHERISINPSCVLAV